MNIHEYQAKELFRQYGIPVPDGLTAATPEEAESAALRLGGPLVVKAQVQAGGRGQAGGVKLVRTPPEAGNAAAALLGRVLRTRQTGAAGKPVHQVLLEKALDISHEYYLSLSIDSAAEQVALVASGEGGMDIEEVAAGRPERICRVNIDPFIGLRAYQLLELAGAIGIPPSLKRQFTSIGLALYRLFTEKDCAMLEINPLALVENGEGKPALVALDAKAGFDAGALFRQPDIAALRDRAQEPPLEARAFDAGLNYVSLKGNIGCLVIGAGLAMATMDAIKLFGGEPGNFLDCGSNSKTEDSREAFEIILAEPGIEGILVNVFGGITQTDLVAAGVIEALRRHREQLPVVVRLEGTGSAEANRLLLDSGLNVQLAGSLTEGAEMIMKLVASQKGRKSRPGAML
ncbi:MAG: ADP-forming succinate--CoA ligase subunit beta [Deltaproteobacteria bacterium]|jgi:succinyl-CoA synthetase beta subunit|nr:ADP-forming succinate--CoA ligase subunit beta [Deltaproteobacteria bacterium]